MHKKSVVKRLLLIPMVLVLALSMTACGKTEDTQGDADNNLVIYSPNSDELIQATIPAFEKKTGIKVDLITAGTGDIQTRIDSEKSNPQADINYGGINLVMLHQYPENYEEYVSENDEKLPEEYRVVDNTVSNYCLNGSAAILVNEKVCEELGVDPSTIDSYESLLNPKLKGHIAMGNPATSSSAWAELTNMLLVMGKEPYDDAAWDWVAKFAENLDGKLLDSSSAIYKGTADGEYAVGVSYEDPCVTLLDNGAENIKLVYPKEGAVWLPAGVAVVKGAPHKENAHKFIDFLLSDEGQQCIAKTNARPINTEMKNESKNMKSLDEINVKTEDLSVTSEHKKEWQDKWNEIFMEAAK